jgi:hypothetical protein
MQGLSKYQALVYPEFLLVDKAIDADENGAGYLSAAC